MNCFSYLSVTNEIFYVFFNTFLKYRKMDKKMSKNQILNYFSEKKINKKEKDSNHPESNPRPLKSSAR